VTDGAANKTTHSADHGADRSDSNASKASGNDVGNSAANGAAPTAAALRDRRNLNRAIFLLSLAAFTSGSTMRVADAMLPELSREYAASLTEVARVVSWYAIVYGCMQLVMGALGDRFGRMRVVTFATCGCAVASLLCAMTSTLDQLVLARLATACAAAGIIPTSLAWIGDRVPYAERQLVLARFSMGTTLGLAGGQLLGGLFVDSLGWRWAFGTLAVCFFVSGVMLLRAVGRDVQPVAVAQAGFFGRIALVLRQPWPRVVYLVTAGEAAAAFATLALTPTYLHHELGLPLSAAGSIVASFGVGSLLYTMVARHFITRLGEAGLVGVGAPLFGLSFLGLIWAQSGLVAAALCFAGGFGFYMMHNTIQTNVTQLAPAARGTGVALFATTVFIAQAAGVAGCAILMDRFGGRVVLVLTSTVFALTGLLFAAALMRRAAQRH